MRMSALRFYLYSILVHAVVLAVAVFSMNFENAPGAQPLPPKAITVRQVEKNQVDAEIERMRRQETAKEEAMRERLAVADVPEPFKGSAIGMITAGLMSLAFMGFAGLV